MVVFPVVMTSPVSRSSQRTSSFHWAVGLLCAKTRTRGPAVKALLPVGDITQAMYVGSSMSGVGDGRLYSVAPTSSAKDHWASGPHVRFGADLVSRMWPEFLSPCLGIASHPMKQGYTGQGWPWEAKW